ncbi:hypothetical protein QYE76_030781 [Lolium multiflorum]|uniref:Chromo domain-containing protein n=1 Tax=Lolium multiflorum TaxID=4521 RepID=A0AAD8QTY5_LOLMU|nr:hypothetical protein QYE76_030781 [Lolium multiflorum]
MGREPLAPPMLPFRLYIPSAVKTLNQSSKIPEEFRSAAAIDDKFRGAEVCSGTPPGRGISPGVISIDTTAIFIAMTPMMRRSSSPEAEGSTGENKEFTPDYIKERQGVIKVMRDRLKIAQSRQKSYADQKRRVWEPKVGDMVYLKVSPMKGLKRKCLKAPDDPVSHEELELQSDLTYVEKPEKILEVQWKKLRNRAIKYCKIQWQHHPEREATWETEEELRKSYPELFRSNVDPNNVPLASLVAQEENVDVNFIKNNNFNNNAYRNNSGNNYRPYPSANGNGYGNSYGNSYNNNRSVPYGLEAMLKEFISTQTAFNKSVEEKLDKIDTIASRVDRLASDVNLLKLKVMPNNDIDNKITTTANAIQVRINENIRLMAELRARWDREENEKLAKENNVAKVWTITTTSNANSSHVAAPPTINGNIIGVGNVSTPSAKRTKLPEIAKTAETACDKTAEIFPTLGTMIPLL